MTAPTKANPTQAIDFEEYITSLDSPAKFSAAFADGTFHEKVKAYAMAENAERRELIDQIRVETQKAMADWVKDNPEMAGAKGANRLDFAGAAKPGKGNPRAVGAPLNGVIEDFYDLAMTVWHKGPNTPELNEKRRILSEYQEKVPSDGGVLVPEEWRSELLRLSLETAIVRPRARVIPMGAPTLHFPMIDSTSNVSSVYGGIVVYRTEEGAELVESQTSFGSVKLDVTKQTALAHVTNELLRDTGGSIEMIIREIWPEALSYYEDIDYLTATGAGEPMGALTAANRAMVTVAKESGQAADTIVWENVLRMYARMLPQSLARAVWLVSPDAFVELATMALNVGTGGSAVWLNDAHNAPVLTLLGRPVIMTEKVPGVLGDKFDLNLVDFGFYLIGDRQQMTIDSSPHVKFTSDKTTFRMIQRNDGRPWLTSAITPRNNSATLSPFITLDERA